jgi:hypothetical protein
MADASDPQSWNFYAYGRNNPLTNIDPTGLDCIYFNNAGTGVETIDRTNNQETLNTQATDCGKNGGNWVNGQVGSITPDGQGNFNVRSADANGTYTTAMTAPDSPDNPNGTCFGNCNYQYIPGANNAPEQEDIAPSVRQMIQQEAQRSAPVVKGLNCAGAAASTFSPFATPDDAKDLGGYALDQAEDQGVDKGSELAVKGAEKLAKFGGSVGKGAKVAGKLAGKAGAAFGVYKAVKAANEEGCFSGWSRP